MQHRINHGNERKHVELIQQVSVPVVLLNMTDLSVSISSTGVQTNKSQSSNKEEEEEEEKGLGRYIHLFQPWDPPVQVTTQVKSIK